MNEILEKMREELAKRLGLLDEAEVLILTEISIMDLEMARASGALKYISTYYGRRFYEEAEVLRWLKGREV